MKTTKHFPLVALLVLGATLYASCPAGAGTYALTPTGSEPGAAGQFTLSRFHFVLTGNSGPPNYIGFTMWRGCLTVTCQGLTPGAMYSTRAGTFTADRSGNGVAKDTQCTLTYFWYGNVPNAGYVGVSRINPDGSQTPALAAPLPYPPH
jgi:hypothetical protein